MMVRITNVNVFEYFSQIKSTDMKTFLFSLTCIVWLMACESRSSLSNAEMGVDSKSVAPSSEESRSGGSAQASDETTQNADESDKVEIKIPKIIRNGTITISVRDALKSKAEVDAMIAKHKAYVGNEQLDNTDYQANYQSRSASLQIN